MTQHTSIKKSKKSKKKFVVITNKYNNIAQYCVRIISSVVHRKNLSGKVSISPPKSVFSRVQFPDGMWLNTVLKIWI